ncbi:MAG: aspartate aminotransferase family protein [Burkholderiaceae bacterium]
MKLPEHGKRWNDLETEMDEARSQDVDWQNGRIGVYIHYGGEEVLAVAKQAYLKFFSENGLGPRAFPSLVRFERDVIQMTLGLLNGSPQAVGAMTTGGTESIFLAVRAARQWARQHRPNVQAAEILLAKSAHPAFNKAADFYGMQTRRVAIDADFRADPQAMASAINDNTIMVVGSAPAYPHGVIDPIEALAGIATRHNLWLHVDACVGGFIAPFARRLGAPIPPFDFSVEGVRSMSADLHKYGYAAKGASTVLYRDQESFDYQAYTFDEWSHGKYSTNTLVGTRAGGAIAAAWAVMNFLGEDGYMDITKRVMAIREKIEQGVTDLGLTVWGKPELGIVVYGSKERDIGPIADAMQSRHWFVGRTAEPPGIHLMLNLTHEPIVDQYLSDLAWALESTQGQSSKGQTSKVHY